MQLAPGDYLDTLRGQPTIQAGNHRQAAEGFRFGSAALWVQYGRWLWNAVQGDFGYSFTYKIEATTLIKQRLYYTFILSVWATILAWVVAIPARRLHRAPSQRVRGSFGQLHRVRRDFAAGVLRGAAGDEAGRAERHGFPVGGATSIGYDSMDWLGKVKDTGWHLILPVLVLGTRGVAGLMRQMRGNTLEVLSENYILAARARGLSERKVTWKHAVRNSINPLITLFGYELSGLLAGAALVENVMAWPGLGRLLLESVQNSDLYVAMASFVMGTLLLIFGNLIADILLAVTDPRIKFS